MTVTFLVQTWPNARVATCFGDAKTLGNEVFRELMMVLPLVIATAIVTVDWNIYCCHRALRSNVTNGDVGNVGCAMDHGRSHSLPLI